MITKKLSSALHIIEGAAYRLIINRATVYVIGFLYTYTLRLLFCWLYNRPIHEKIKQSPEEKKRIQKVITALKLAQNTADLKSIYDHIYKGYVYDGWGKGFPDWSPSFHSMIYKEKDDCDGMGIVGKYILKEYCRIKKYSTKWINDCSFLYWGKWKGITAAHVMAVAKLDSGDLKRKWILFDYFKIGEFASKQQLKEQYWEYVEQHVPSVKNKDLKRVMMMKLPEWKGLSSKELLD